MIIVDAFNGHWQCPLKCPLIKQFAHFHLIFITSQWICTFINTLFSHEETKAKRGCNNCQCHTANIRKFLPFRVRLSFFKVDALNHSEILLQLHQQRGRMLQSSRDPLVLIHSYSYWRIFKKIPQLTCKSRPKDQGSILFFFYNFIYLFIFGCAGSVCVALEHRLNSCCAWAEELLSPLGVGPQAPALAGGSFTTEPTGGPRARYSLLFTRGWLQNMVLYYVLHILIFTVYKLCTNFQNFI